MEARGVGGREEGEREGGEKGEGGEKIISDTTQFIFLQTIFW